jgi:hypothetical protein
MKCIHCNKDAYAVDTEYDEGYCKKHFDQQQASVEPIEYPRFVQ